VLRLRAEEAEGRAELLLSVPASRFRWLVSTLTVAAITTTAVAVAAGASAAVVLVLGQAGGSSPGTVGATQPSRVASGPEPVPAFFRHAR
jgi:ABC-2 type transport system permease protein